MLSFGVVPMKFNLCTIDLCCDTCARKYFRVIIDAFGYQVYPITSLFYKYPLATILNFNLDLVQPKMSPTLSFSNMYPNHLFIVGIVPILNKYLDFIYQPDRSDRTCVYT